MNRDIIFSADMLQKFRPASADLIKEIIMKSSNKSCDLDPVPSWLLKKCISQSVNRLISPCLKCTRGQNYRMVFWQTNDLYQNVPLFLKQTKNKTKHAVCLVKKSFKTVRFNVHSDITETLDFYAAFGLIDHPILSRKGLFPGWSNIVQTERVSI